MQELLAPTLPQMPPNGPFFLEYLVERGIFRDGGPHKNCQASNWGGFEKTLGRGRCHFSSPGDEIINY